MGRRGNEWEGGESEWEGGGVNGKRGGESEEGGNVNMTNSCYNSTPTPPIGI